MIKNLGLQEKVHTYTGVLGSKVGIKDITSNLLCCTESDCSTFGSNSNFAIWLRLPNVMYTNTTCNDVYYVVA